MSERSSSFLVAPWFEIPSLRRWGQASDAVGILHRYSLTLDLLLQNFLDSLQPPGGQSAGDLPVELGYTVSINIYDLFSKNSSGQWQFDTARMEFFIDLFRRVERPVVVNLRANHFVGEDPLVGELMAHESSFARLNDGSPVKEIYYSNAVFAPNFSLDESLPLNRYRFEGFRRAAAILAEFDRWHPGVIRAVTLAGELHHFLPELANPMAAGQFENVRMTDYSAESVRDFAAWLQPRHHTVAQLNERFGTAFASWEEIEPPRWNLRVRNDAPAWSHIDSYANGCLPVFGWVRPPVTGSLTVYLDGVPVGQAEYGLSRLDVYDAVPGLADSDVGFRFDLDYRRIAPGRHVLHVVLENEPGRRFLVGDRRIVIARHFGQEPESLHPAPDLSALYSLPPCVERGEGFAWLDQPPHDLVLCFNPYAAEWQEFREHQVEALLLKFAQLAVTAGIAPEKLYSHQIMPQFEGSWNRVAFAVPARPPANSPYSPGIDLYGGAAVYRGLPQFLQGSRYAVPEMHPRMGKRISRDVFLRALQYHRDLGATFISPYFMALREPLGQRTTADPANLQDALLIHPLNIGVGSLFFYSAIIKFLNSDC